MITTELLRAYLTRGNASAQLNASQEFLDSCTSEANVMVTDYMGDQAVPDDVADRVRLEVAAELYRRRDSTTAGAPVMDGAGAPVPSLMRDPRRVMGLLLAGYVAPLP